MKYLILFLITTLSFSSVYAQYDTAHYIAPSRWGYFNDKHEVVLSTESTASVTVSIFSSDGTLVGTTTVSKGSPTRYRMPNPLVGSSSNQTLMVLSDRGMIIRAPEPVSANIRNFSGDSFQPNIKGNSSLTSKGVLALGTDFRLVFYRNTSVYYGILAKENNTTINQNGTFLISLNAGESYLIQGASANLGDHITSDKPISLTSSHNADVPGSCGDAIADQMIPIELAGEEFLTVRGNGRQTLVVELTTVVATEDNTSVFVNGVLNTVLMNAGDFVTINNGTTLFDVNYITTDKPVYAAQGAGEGCEHGMSVLPSLKCTGSNHIETKDFNNPGASGKLPYKVFVLAKCVDVPTLNGVALTGGTPISTTDWNLYTFNNNDVTGTDIILDNSSVMHVGILQDGGVFGGYAYFSGFDKSEIKIEAASISGDSILQEGCEGASFTFKREIRCGNDTILINVSGSATEGVDFNDIPDTLIFGSGVDSIYVPIDATFDQLDEPQESLTVTILIDKNCDGVLDTTRSTLYISNYTPMVLDVTDSLVMCIDPDHTFVFEEGTLSATVVDGGLSPYTFTWEGGFSQTVSSPPYTSDYAINSNTGIFPAVEANTFVKVSDRCGQEVTYQPITMINQCPWIVPNIFTPNGDGQNDFFVAANSEQYKNSHLTVFNRWGVKVFESMDYQNDWSGDDLSDGVYYFILTNPSPKLEEKKGFVHLLR